jgi:P27 family predicted phage terminase small subunit
MPEPPDHLGPLALVEWQRLAPELARIGVLTMADRTALAAYCQLYQQWVYAERYIQEQLVIRDPHTSRIVQNPLIRIANRTLELMRGYMGELGLTPSSRVRLVEGALPVDDPLEQFLAQSTPRHRKDPR